MLRRFRFTKCRLALGVLGSIHLRLVSYSTLPQDPPDLNPSVMLLLATVFVPETYAPTLLRRKAVSLQAEADAAGTGEHFISKYDRVKKSTVQVVKIGLARPFQLLFQEAIVFCLSIYIAIIYGT